MPLTTATVSGYLTKPDGSTLENGIVTFMLSGMASSDNYMVNSQKVIAETDGNGLFSVDIMPNAQYQYPTSYSVIGYEVDGVTGEYIRGYDFGRIRVPVDGGDIQDLLPVPNYGNENSVTVIKGDDIHWQVVWVDDIGFPVDLSSATIACKFIHDGGTEYSATIDDTAAASGKFVVSADTSSYLLGQYKVRISITNGGVTKTQSGKMRITE